jgi:hypothetical protein
MISWPKRASRALARLFEPLQPLDVFVEDTGSEVFYKELFMRAAPRIHIERVIPLGGRQEVLDAVANHDFSRRRALFLVDGDFEWVRDDPPPKHSAVYRLDAYCVENVLISETGAAEILSEAMVVSVDDAKKCLQFQTWRRAMAETLVPLFAAYAVLNAVDATHPTTARGIGSLLTNFRYGPSLDKTKVAAEIARIEQLLRAAGIAETEIQARRGLVEARAVAMNEPSDVVSGKDFIMPLLEFEIRRHAPCPLPRRRSICLRLAKSCDQNRLRQLAVALEAAARWS